MTFKEIQDLIKLMDKSNLSEFSFKTETYEVKIKGPRSYAPTMLTTAVPSMPVAMPTQAAVTAQTSSAQEGPRAEDAAPKAAAEKLIEIKSPMVGTFYRSSAPDKPAFVSVGDSVQKGSVVCIIEAMKLFNEIESEFAGKIVKVLVEDASPVEYDQVLFLVEP
ncbi:MAG: acetyl-CoA carboxylase biotin carboxyl carrier protein [Saprospiraceae bacterium]|nr:acetyl-CoA carboxylase biotin carboxyl carrier protein [Saprospiraceae bacterium]MBK7789210.1 acetyl-CoA carboxylase biotin carboxyl carrier protein [Saprospiraceae bacterium]MBK8112566.1 acetyl-CoA carboxylase biotin carboxyl carrier protein [Saprospiraceae bacterium]MBK8852166.1 acetyl-CoA carboxylase biotin carboxyl carrier protein [Saprospiraceae bacterium]